MVDKGGGAGKTISVQDWEQVLQDFRTSSELQQKWLAIWPGLALVEQALLTILKKEIPIKAQLLVFIEENADVLIGSEVLIGFEMILVSLRGVLQSQSDGVFITSTIRENMMVMATIVAIVTDTLHVAREKLEELVELFLMYINRPNHTSDRHIRGLACDCLRELEMAYPCLLYGCVGHIHFLCRHEKTHANQSYTLLLTTIMENLSTRMYTIRSNSASYLPILQNTTPLVPFSVPFFLVSSSPGKENQLLPKRELTPGNLRELRTVVAFLLARPQLLTVVGMLELVSSVIKISKAIDLSGPTLKTHFSSILHSYSPVLCHIVLLLYTHFMESMDGADESILRRLVAFGRDDSQSLPFRLLGIHWLLAIEALHIRNQKTSVIAAHASGLYPSVFDPLSLKGAKMGALAYCAVSLDKQERVSQGNGLATDTTFDPPSVLLNEGLLSVSSYCWLPPWSTEAQLAFHIFHRFLTVAVPHSRNRECILDRSSFRESSLFQTLQKIVVTMAAQMQKLVPNLVALLDRLMDCDAHRALGQRLLQTCNEVLLPQLSPDHHLPSYFPLLERIAENGEIPPSALIDKIAVYIKQRVEGDEGEDEEWILWSCSTQVLEICRIVLLHYHSSRIFHALAPLLGFLCRFYPDLEVRDTARLYLRMLISIPGDKLRSILRFGDERKNEVNAPPVSPLPTYKSLQQPLLVASYVQLTRITPLLVRQSWSIVLFDAGRGSEQTLDGSDDTSSRSDGRGDAEESSYKREVDKRPGNMDVGFLRPSRSKRALRVMDSRTSEVILILRSHFGEIPDFVNGAGLQIKVPCTLRYFGEYHQRFNDDVESVDTPNVHLPSISDLWPALYAAVITFKTSGFYGPIPRVRVPFLLSEPPQKRTGDGQGANANEDLEVQNNDRKGKGVYYLEDSLRGADWPSDDKDDTRLVQKDSTCVQAPVFSELVIIDLEPKQPVPTLVDVHIEFSNEDGLGVQGQLNSIAVSIEDLFVKPPVPSNLSPVNQTEYLLNLFEALWEACSGPGRLGTETFLLKDGLESVNISGSESVKLLEAQADRVVAAVEQYLAQFVVAVDGGPLGTMARDGGTFQDVKWLEEESISSGSDVTSGHQIGSPLTKSTASESSFQIQVRDPGQSRMDDMKSGLGSFLILILLPPRYHLLLRMEVADESTLVRIRTDHWPCLAHVDEYLEVLTLPR